jgi:hypothetical protein
MIVTDIGFRMWYKKEYGKDLPEDKYYGVEHQWSQKEVEMAEKYLEGGCFNDFTGIDLLEYTKDYVDKILVKYNINVSKEKLLEILETIKRLFETEILKQINYNIIMLVIDYRIIYDEILPDVLFDEYIIEKLKRNGNHKEWLGE